MTVQSASLILLIIMALVAIVLLDNANMKLKNENAKLYNKYRSTFSRYELMEDKAVALEKALAIRDAQIAQMKTSRGKARGHINYNSLLQPAGLSLSQAEEFLRGTLLFPYAEAFLEADEKFGVNALFLMALARHESGNGEYPYMAQNNPFSWKGDGPGGYDVFPSVEESIMYVASRLSLRMKTSGNVGIHQVHNNIYKAEDPLWADKIMSVIHGEGYE